MEGMGAVVCEGMVEMGLEFVGLWFGFGLFFLWDALIWDFWWVLWKGIDGMLDEIVVSFAFGAWKLNTMLHIFY